MTLQEVIRKELDNLNVALANQETYLNALTESAEEARLEFEKRLKAVTDQQRTVESYKTLTTMVRGLLAPGPSCDVQ